MRKAFPFAIFFSFLFSLLPAQDKGEEIYKTSCASCHTINKGRLIGPDLAGIYEKRDNEWLIRFIRSSQEMIKSGDPEAVAIYNEYNKIPMPDNKLTDDQIQSVIRYIQESDQAIPVAEKGDTTLKDNISAARDSITAADDTLKYTAEIYDAGRYLYYGFAEFTNGAAPCVSCHNINDRSIMGGGRLAIDLTASFTRLGPSGIRAILLNPPFPAMRNAIPGVLTEEEINALVILLKSVSERNLITYNASSGGVIFFILGFICAIFLLLHIYLFYDNRNIPENTPTKLIASQQEPARNEIKEK